MKTEQELHNEGHTLDYVEGYLAGRAEALEAAAAVAEKHGRNWEAGLGKWASNDIADQIRFLPLRK